MARRLFGTDGIRGRAGAFPLDPSTVSRLGRSLVEHLQERNRPGRVVIGYDTRESSVPLCTDLLGGIRAGGGEAAVAGVIPTPGIAFLTRAGGFDAGLIISASHNPHHDNGIKVFQAQGTKLSDADEELIEGRLLDSGAHGKPAAAPALPLVVDDRLVDDYVTYLIECLRGRTDLSDARVVVDCANGASSRIAPRVLEALGVDASFLSCDPDGTNINQECGSLHPEALAERVRGTGAGLGLALDGDADRCLAVDETGRLLDGDYILYLAARDLKRRGVLRNDTVIATVMSNMWLEERLEVEGIKLVRTPVGDKYVLEEMVRGDHVLGGEQSGHVIFRDLATTGDGLLTGLMLLTTWKGDRRPLSEMVAGITPFPQVLLNVEVTSKPDLSAHKDLGPLLRQAEQALSGRGRLLVRYSGTESLARVMAEGRDADEIRRIAGEVADALRAHLA